MESPDDAAENTDCSSTGASASSSGEAPTTPTRTSVRKVSSDDRDPPPDAAEGESLGLRVSRDELAEMLLSLRLTVRRPVAQRGARRSIEVELAHQPLYSLRVTSPSRSASSSA